MGLEDYLVTAVLRGVLAQRLVRRLCPECRRAAPAPAALAARFDLARRAPAGSSPPMLWHPVGLPRTAAAPAIAAAARSPSSWSPTPRSQRIFSRADEAEIERAAIEGGMVPMFDAGLDAALAGETTLEEVVRSMRAEG